MISHPNLLEEETLILAGEFVLTTQHHVLTASSSRKGRRHDFYSGSWERRVRRAVSDELWSPGPPLITALRMPVNVFIREWSAAITGAGVGFPPLLQNCSI